MTKPEEIECILQSVLGVLNSPDRWCKYAAALDVNGVRINERHSLAVQWCLEGAIRVSSDLWRLQSATECHLVKHMLNDKYLLLRDFNDGQDTKYEDVIALLQRGIGACGKTQIT